MSFIIPGDRPTTNKGLALMRAGIACAQVSNPMINGQWLADELWLAGETINAGAVRNNGGNRYVALVAGICAGAGGPTGTNYAPIIDNTVQWEYVGPAVTTSLPGAPTVTVDATDRSGTYTRSYGPSLSNTVSVASDSAFNVRSGEPFVSIALAPPVISQWAATTTSIDTGRAGRFGQTWEFETDAQSLVIEGHFTNLQFAHRLILDGRMLRFGIEKASAATRTTILIQFAAPGNHTVSLSTTNLGGFKCVRVLPTNTIWAPPKIGASIWTMGNSFFTGGGGLPNNTSIMQSVGYQLGASRMIDAGTGGTGFDTAGSARIFALRLNEAQLFAPDAIIVQSSYFDPANVTAAACKSVMMNFLSVLRSWSNLRNTPVFIFGEFAASTGPNTNTIQRELGGLQGIAEFNDPLVFGIANSTALPNSWVRGTGRTTAPANNGNADFITGPDGTHQSFVGSLWYANRIADAIINAVNGSSL